MNNHEAGEPLITPGKSSINRAIEILRLVACGQEAGVRLTDLVQMSAMNRPTVHRILKTLVSEGAVEQDASSRRYRIGTEIILLGIARTRRFPILSIANANLAQLAQDVGDTAFLSIRHGHDSICISRQSGHYPIQVLSIDVGARRPLGVGVSGVALLSRMDAKHVAQIAAANERRLKFHNLEPDELIERVQAARDTGYAYTEAGVRSGTRAVSIPVISKRGDALAALTITAMADRLTADRLPAVVGLMQVQADNISRQHQEVERISQGTL